MMRELNDRESSDLRLCVDGVLFNVHRAVLARHSSLVRGLIESPLQKTGDDAVHIALPKVEIGAELVEGRDEDVAPLTAFETFLGVCYRDPVDDLERLRPDQLFAVAVIADFMIADTILAVVDGRTARLEFGNHCWAAAFVFAKTFRLRRTCERLLESQNLGLFHRLTMLDVFFQLDETEMMAILRNLKLPILGKIFATFWYCTGLRDDEFGRKETLRIVGDAKSAAFVRFMDELIAKINDTPTLEFLLDMTDRFELLSDNSQEGRKCYPLYRMIARQALKL